MRVLALLPMLAAAALPVAAQTQSSDWSLGVYAGRYYDTEPAGFLQGNAQFVDQNMLAVTASKTLWRSASLPLSIELDGMLGVQWGQATLQEVALAPALRWNGFPWNDVVRTSVSLAPLGISYTSKVSPLERGRDGQGSEVLNWLFMEVAMSSPRQPSLEWFGRLHHRCAIYDMLNNYGANGEDFFAVGVRYRF